MKKKITITACTGLLTAYILNPIGNLNNLTSMQTVYADSNILGDANSDGTLNVRDCAFIASKLANGEGAVLPLSADFNGDGTVNVRDAAAIAKFLADGNKDKLYVYDLLTMTAGQINDVLGDCYYSIFNREGQCYQVTSDNYPGLHILFTNLSIYNDFDSNAVPTDIIMTQGSASDRLYCGMTLSECFEINGNQKLYVNSMDGTVDTEIIYDGYCFRVQFDPSYYTISNEDYTGISVDRVKYYVNCNPKIYRIWIDKL